MLTRHLIILMKYARIQNRVNYQGGISILGTTKHIAVAAMTTFYPLFASIALALPVLSAAKPVFVPLGAAVLAAGIGGDDLWAQAAKPSGPPLLLRKAMPMPAVPSGLAGPLKVDTWNQVRIEQQVFIRINPRNAGRDTLAPQVLPVHPVAQPINPQLRPTTVQVRVRERKAGKCMPSLGIAAVQPITDGRLMFYMRDRRMIAAGLEKACSARDFYLGFYMSKTTDGQLCVGRDQIHSRAGTTCKLKSVREYVPVE